MPGSPRSTLPLVLASGSPRRRDLLQRAGVDFVVRPVDIPEVRGPGEPPEPFALRLAREKAEAGARALRQTGEPAGAVLGADTIVVLGEDVLGKPRDPAHAEQMLGGLVVITAVAVIGPPIDPDGEPHCFAVHSEVRMRPASADEIRDYVATGESLDKAGSYALQGEGRRFVDEVTGSSTNVIGLPIDETLSALRNVGIHPKAKGA